MTQADHGEQAAEILRAGLGRRGLLRATAALGIAGAVGAPATAAAHAGQSHRDGRLPILQPGTGPIKGAYLRTTPETVLWGALPNRTATPLLTISSGSIVTVDTVSHANMSESHAKRRRLRHAKHAGQPAGRALALRH